MNRKLCRPHELNRRDGQLEPDAERRASGVRTDSILSSDRMDNRLKVHS
jgi:hypothetical protein